MEQNPEPAFLEEFEDLFSDTRGTIKDVKARIIVEEKFNSRYFKPRPVPYALKEKIRKTMHSTGPPRSTPGGMSYEESGTVLFLVAQHRLRH